MNVGVLRRMSVKGITGFCLYHDTLKEIGDFFSFLGFMDFMKINLYACKSIISEGKY